MSHVRCRLFGHYMPITMDCPQDPFMLLSFVNTKLRDEYSSLDDLCRSLDIERSALEEKLAEAGFVYMEHINQFK